jgi:hypothetical protein
VRLICGTYLTLRSTTGISNDFGVLNWIEGCAVPIRLELPGRLIVGLSSLLLLNIYTELMQNDHRILCITLRRLYIARALAFGW